MHITQIISNLSLPPPVPSPFPLAYLGLGPRFHSPNRR